jgi:hypothetical protein
MPTHGFRENERIRRKTARWVRMFATMTSPEKAAILAGLTGSAPTRCDPGPQRPITILCTCVQSTYEGLPGVETYGKTRDARTWPGGTPCVAHPPCAQWGRLRALATHDVEEKALGPFCVAAVRANGGVLEHPAGSTLWQACGLPAPGRSDEWGGFTLDVDQVVWGHKAQKRTWLYVCGCRPEAVPPIPAPGAVPTHRVSSSAQTFHKLPALSKHLRDATPPKLAMWLIETARLCQRPLAAIAESGSVCAQGPAKRHTPALGEPQAESLPGGEIHTSFS